VAAKAIFDIHALRRFFSLAVRRLLINKYTIKIAAPLF